VSTRDLTVLGSASAVPTRTRNHNGYLLRWDGHGILFDPGEGTQRQMSFAGLAATDVTWLCVTHFHGDHCLGVPGIVQRIARDRVPHPVRAVYPASGAVYWDRLRHISERYLAADEAEFVRQAAAAFGGEIVLAHDLDRIGLPPRRRTA
jgi:ribonuclease Z